MVTNCPCHLPFTKIDMNYGRLMAVSFVVTLTLLLSRGSNVYYQNTYGATLGTEFRKNMVTAVNSGTTNTAIHMLFLHQLGSANRGVQQSHDTILLKELAFPI